MRALALGLLLVSASAEAAKDTVWSWDPAPDLYPLLDLSAGSVVLSNNKLRGTSWAVTLDEPDDVAGAGLVADDTRVFVATYNRIAAGCDLAAFEIATGKKVWAVHLEGIGPIAHSKYSNRVQLRLVDGHPTVFGDEAKRYIEQRDAATGVQRAHQLLPAQRQPIPIAEPLYRELDNMLAKQAKYVVRVNDFLTRHVAMKDDDHAARGAVVRDAVRRLDGLAVARGKYRLAVTVVEKGGDFEITATRAP